MYQIKQIIKNLVNAKISKDNKIIVGTNYFKNNILIYKLYRGLYELHSRLLMQNIRNLSISDTGETLAVDNCSGDVFVFCLKNNNWIKEITITSNINYLSYKSLAINGKGDTVLIGTLPRGEDPVIGIVYARDKCGVWSLQAKLTASELGSAIISGIKAAISSSGDTVIIVGRGKKRPNNIFVSYTRVNGCWSQQPELVANDPSDGYYDAYGSISMSSNGKVLAVDACASSCLGRKYYVLIFDKQSAGWKKQASFLLDDAIDKYGEPIVNINGDGNIIMAGLNYQSVNLFVKKGKTWFQKKDTKVTEKLAFTISMSKKGDLSLIETINYASLNPDTIVFSKI